MVLTMKEFRFGCKTSLIAFLLGSFVTFLTANENPPRIRIRIALKTAVLSSSLRGTAWKSTELQHRRQNILHSWPFYYCTVLKCFSQRIFLTRHLKTNYILCLTCTQPQRRLTRHLVLLSVMMQVKSKQQWPWRHQIRSLGR